MGGAGQCWDLGRDAAFFQHVADENAGLGAGSTTGNCRYWQALQSSTYDPVYGEADPKSDFLGPFTIVATLEYDEEQNYNQDAAEEYVEREYDGMASISYSEWQTKVVGGVPQAGLDAPREGDIVSFFDGFLTFEVLKVMRTGFVNMTSAFTNYKLELKRRQSFEPERRLP